MTTLNKLLDKAQEVCSTDMAIAARLGISRSAVSKWRKGGQITPEHLAKLIEIAKADAAMGLMILAEQDAKGAGGRVWSVGAKRLGAAAAVVLVAVVALPALQAHDGSALAYLPVMIMRTVHYAKSKTGWNRSLSRCTCEPLIASEDIV